MWNMKVTPVNLTESDLLWFLECGELWNNRELRSKIASAFVLPGSEMESRGTRNLVLSSSHYPSHYFLHGEEGFDHGSWFFVNWSEKGLWASVPVFNDKGEFLAKKADVPEEFKPVLELAEKLECFLVLFHPKGRVFSCLPVYEQNEKG